MLPRLLFRRSASLRSLVAALALCLAAPPLAAQTIHPVTEVTTVGSSITSAMVGGVVFGRNRMVGGTATTFAASAAGVVLTTGGTEPPAAGARAGFIGDGYLDTGLLNPSTATDAVTVTFPQPIVNRPGVDILLFEINSGTAADECRVKINGMTVAVGTASWGNTGYATASADLYNTRNAADTDIVTVTTLPQLESAPLALNSADTSQPVWGVALDLSDFGVASGASISSLTMWSSGTTFDPVFVAGLVVPPEQTGGPVISELLASNQDGIEDEDLDHPDWIEIYNGQDAAVNLAGWKLSDDPAQPGKWTFPGITVPGYGYTYVFASGKSRFTNAHAHTNFTLPKTGGTLVLTQPNGTTASQIAFPAQVEDISYGTMGAAQTIGFLETPSPGTANVGRQAAGPPVDGPVFDRASAVVTSASPLAMSLPPTAGAGAEIRYLFGSAIPGETATLYSGPVAMSAGATVSARVFQPGRLPSRVGRRSFVQLASDLGANYNSSGAPFSSHLPVLVLDSFSNNIDGTNAPAGLRPHRFTQVAVYDVNLATGRASLGETPALITRAGVHVRGQSSSGFSQKPYALEFWQESVDEDVSLSLLGMPAESDWVLQTLWTDKTFMRNYTMQQLMLETNGPVAGRRARFVEVIFNQNNTTCDYGDYRGVYLLLERIKRDTDRVDVAKLNGEMTETSRISGGYIFKKDKTPWDAPFNPPTVSGSSWNGLTYDIFDPEPPTAAQMNWLRSYINQADIAIMQTDFSNPASPNYYGRWLDWRSFIDKQIWQETCKEVDSYIYSYYYSKDRGQPLRAFPFWDVDRSLGNANYGTADNAFGWRWWTAGSGYAYFPRLFLDPEFTQAYWDRWWTLRRGAFATGALLQRIEDTAAQITGGADPATISNGSAPAMQNPAARHFRKYNTLGTNSYGSGPVGQADRNTYRKELDLMKAWLTYRLNWIDAQSPLRPPDVRDAANGEPRFGGAVPAGFQMRLVHPNESGGTVYYSLNGVDPRQTGGAVAPGALTATAGTVAYTTLISNGAAWRFLAPSSDPGTAWRGAAFDDSGWASGPSPLGYGEAGMSTAITPSGTNPVFFRSSFHVAAPASVAELQLELMVDDGAVIYLNGVEAARDGMPYPPTAIGFGTAATGDVSNSNAEANYHLIRLDPALLVAGSNSLAISVHQNGSAGDMRFAARLKALAAPTSGTPVTLGSGVQTLRARSRVGATWSPLTQATFVVDAVPAVAANVVISEVLYRPANPSAAESSAGYEAADFEFIELLNVGANHADLGGARFSEGVTCTFPTNDPERYVLPPGGRLVVAANLAAFAARYGSPPAVRLAGPFEGNLSNSGERLTLLDAAGAILAQFTYGTSEPWPVAAGAGYSLVLNNPAAGANYASGFAWRASAALGGTPGEANGATFSGSLTADTDHDGVPDFLEFACGSSPNDPASSAVPVVTLGQNYLEFRYRRNLAAEGVRYFVELSENMSGWSGEASAVTYVGTQHHGDGTATVTWRSTNPATHAFPQMFMRLRVTP